MFKRVERKRKKRDEEEELGLDEDMREIMGLNDTDSDESDSTSGSEQDSGDDAQNDTDSENEEVEDGEDIDQEDEVAEEESPITVAEALKDPLFLISLDPIVHGCVLCKGKVIKNAGMAAAHKNAGVHKRHLEQFKKLAADADAQSDAWDLVRAIRTASSLQKHEQQGLSKRALKRQAKQASIRDKRKRHQELKAKAIAKKAANRLAKDDKAGSASPENSPTPPLPQATSEHPRKKQKSQRKTSTGTMKSILKVKLDAASSTKASTNVKASRKSRVQSHTKHTAKTDKKEAT